MTTTSSAPLHGVRVLDLTSVVVGPYCTELLGDFGADVIKVESLEGDMTRSVGPRRSEGMSAQFLTFNRNKRTIALDLKHEDGRAALLRLAATCDVFVANMRPRALAKLQITYDDLRAVNPAIVYCRVIGFPPEHPNNERPAIDDVIQAAAGIVALQQELTGEPSYVGMPLADQVVGLMALAAVLAALVSRASTGEGEEIEIPMFDAIAGFVLAPHIGGWNFEPPLGPPLYGRSVARSRRLYKTTDGVLCIAPYSDKQWRRFLESVELQDLLEEERFSTPYARAQHLGELMGILEPLIAQRTSGEWVRICEEADVPVAEVQTTAELLVDPTLHERGLIRRAAHPTEGEIRLLGNGVRFSKAPCVEPEVPHRLGEDTRAVLLEAGYGEEEIESLLERGVASVAPAAPAPVAP